MTDLAGAIARTARTLAGAHVEALACAYRSVGTGTHSPGSAAKVAKALPATQQARLAALNTAWAAAPDTQGAAIALGLEAALAAHRHNDGPTVEVVATGPATPAAPVRLTSQVVLNLIAGATQRITIVSFAAYKIPTVIAALEDAVARGVKVALILESPENLEGGGGAGAYAGFATYRWPTGQRPTGALLHAKAVVVDSRDVLLTSANLTNAAYDKHLEIGVLCRGGQVAAQVQKHFDNLIATGMLERVG